MATIAAATVLGGCHDAPARVEPLGQAVTTAAGRAVAWASRTAQHLTSTQTAQPLELVPTVSLHEEKEKAEAPEARRISSQQKAMVALPAPRKPRPAPLPVVEPSVVEAPPAMPAPEPPAVTGGGAGEGTAGNGTATPSGAGRAATQAAPPALAPRVSRAAPARAREERTHLTTPVIVASSVGAIGLAMGAIGAGFGDGPVEPGFAVAGAGIGVVGLATAGILLLIQPDEAEPRRVRVGVGPGAVAVRGGF